MTISMVSRACFGAGTPWLRFGLIVAALVSAPNGFGAETPPDDEAIPVLDEVLVTGDQPGPGLWRVSRGEHTLWVLGTLSPLPRRMRWASPEVETRIAQSQTVLAPPAVRFDAGIGRVRALFLLPALLGARKNPDGRKLADVVSPELYARWRALKAQHMPRNRAVERWRPLFAAQKLYEEAIEAQGLRSSRVVWPVVEKTAKRHEVAIVSPVAEVRIEAPRDAIKAFARSSLDDVDCFALTLERLELDLRNMRERANAWAMGDLERLAQLSFVDQGPACIEAMLNSSVISEQGLADLPERVRASWLEAAEQALAEHTTSFAVLPMRLVLAEDGYLEDLRARGFEIEAPL